MRPAVASQEGPDERALTVHSHHDSCTPRASDLRARAVMPEQTDAPVAHCRCRWIIGITGNVSRIIDRQRHSETEIADSTVNPLHGMLSEFLFS